MKLCIPFLLALINAELIYAQKQELAGSLSALLGTERTAVNGSRFSLGPDYALGLDYEHRILKTRPISLFAGIDFAASQLRSVSSSDQTLTRDVATIYLTPNVMAKFHSIGRVVPWATVGGGVSIYEQSEFRIDGQRNGATRDVTHGVFMYGAGVDVPIWRFVALRGQVRDFYSGSPSYNTAVTGGQHNVLAGGALVFRWGR